MTAIVLVSALVASVLQGGSGRLLYRAGGRTSTLVRTTRSPIAVNVALGLVTSIQLPKRVRLTAEPVLGNQAIFSFQTQPNRLLVWPRLPAHPDRPVRSNALLGHTTNLQIFLDFGLSVIVQLRIARQRRAVQQVRLTFPERRRESAYVRAMLDRHARRFR